MSFTQKCLQIVGSRRFFYLIVGFFAFEALWFALSARYPMAADEDFHFGIIKLYTHQWSPFFAHQPAGADAYGAVTRDPSYLYHYLMSFPLRLIQLCTNSQGAQVVILRLINIVFAVAALLNFRKVLEYTKLSPAASNIVFILLALTPIVPFVAGQINYDNLFFLCTALAFLLSLRLTAVIRSTKKLPVLLTTNLLVLCFLSSLVKYAFLAIFAGLGVYLVCVVVRHGRSPRVLVRSMAAELKRLSMAGRLLLIIGLVVSSGLFIERYGYNLWRYHAPAPECNQVLSVKQCMQYGPWARNYRFATTYYSHRLQWSPITFTEHWVGNYVSSLEYALNGPFSGYAVGHSLPVLTKTVTVLLVSGTALLAIYGWQIWRQDAALRLLLVAALVYVAILWLQNYADFRHLGQAVAQQGRYLLPVLLVFYAWWVRAFVLALGHIPRPQIAKLAVAGVACLLLLQGGGVLTFMARSDDSWYWENNRIVTTTNHAAQKVVRPLLIGA